MAMVPVLHKAIGQCRSQFCIDPNKVSKDTHLTSVADPEDGATEAACVVTVAPEDAATED